MPHISPERERTLCLQQRAFDFAAAVLLQCPNDISHLGARELCVNSLIFASILIKVKRRYKKELEEKKEAKLRRRRKTRRTGRRAAVNSF
jgi:hypothetical protein